MKIMQVFIKTYGCSANIADSETLAGCLSASGFSLSGSEENAEVIIFNSCAVKNPTENRIIYELKRVPRTKKVVVTGCLPLISMDRLFRETRFDAVVGPAAGKEIVDVVQRVLTGETVTQLEGALTAMPQLDLPRIPSNPLVSIVPVNYGCLGSCTFCCVVHARGHLRSYSTKEVVERVRNDIGSGAKEVWITSQDTACYGRDIDTNLAELLKAIVAINGNFKIRVGMMTPNLIEPFLDDLISAFRNSKVFKFIHLPVQTGDNQILRIMKRFYSMEQFRQIVATFRKAFPEITLSTDVIVGFPGESVEAFENTLKLLNEVTPDIVNVSKFFARPKTAAWKLRTEAVDPEEIKRRSSKTAVLVKQISLKRNQLWVGWRGEILVDEKGKVAGTWVGRNYAYKPIALKSDSNLMGKTVHVKVEKAFSTHLIGTFE
jgi:threonylcarbamoyladenosine tRNA methylthiotransferase CDKAL1